MLDEQAWGRGRKEARDAVFPTSFQVMLVLFYEPQFQLQGYEVRLLGERACVCALRPPRQFQGMTPRRCVTGI